MVVKSNTYVVIVDVVNLEIIRILAFVLRDALAIGGDPTRPPLVPGAVSRMKIVNVPLFKIVQVRRQGRFVQPLGRGKKGECRREDGAKSKRRPHVVKSMNSIITRERKNYRMSKKLQLLWRNSGLHGTYVSMAIIYPEKKIENMSRKPHVFPNRCHR